MIQLKNISERGFAAYLDDAKHAWDHHPDIPGQSKKPDFAFLHNSVQILCDVKERRPNKEQLEANRRKENALLAGEQPESNARHFDPVAQVRHLIKKGWEKFRDFDGHLCVLVFYNNGNRHTRLTPTCIYGTILGDPGFQATFSPETCTVDISSIQSGFLPWIGEKARRYETLKNISAVVALDTYRIPNPAYQEAFDEEVDRQTNLLGRPLTNDERAAIPEVLILDRGMRATLGEAQGVTVCTNPFAKITFPVDLFTGPFDEHWSVVDRRMTRVFVGEQRSALDQPDDGIEV